MDGAHESYGKVLEEQFTLPSSMSITWRLFLLSKGRVFNGAFCLASCIPFITLCNLILWDSLSFSLHVSARSVFSTSNCSKAQGVGHGGILNLPISRYTYIPGYAYRYHMSMHTSCLRTMNSSIVVRSEFLKTTLVPKRQVISCHLYGIRYASLDCSGTVTAVSIFWWEQAVAQHNNKIVGSLHGLAAHQQGSKAQLEHPASTSNDNQFVDGTV